MYVRLLLIQRILRVTPRPTGYDVTTFTNDITDQTVDGALLLIACVLASNYVTTMLEQKKHEQIYESDSERDAVAARIWVPETASPDYDISSITGRLTKESLRRRPAQPVPSLRLCYPSLPSIINLNVYGYTQCLRSSENQKCK
ncbi:hypothetical protein J6590_067095 [Homalodisca vitripennis]|nr:hypothetical protein J6590_067095 [Homalodisca vitripennis]